MYLGFGLLHQREGVRDATVDLFNQLRAYPVSVSLSARVALLKVNQVGVLFLQALNHFQRYAYVRQAHAREKRTEQQQFSEVAYPTPLATFSSRTHSNSIGASG